MLANQKFASHTRVKHKDGWEGTIHLFVPGGMLRNPKDRYIVNKSDDPSGKVWADADDLELAEVKV